MVEIVNYNTDYLDAIDGHVTDLAPAVRPRVDPAQTQGGPARLVLPSSQSSAPLATVMQTVMHQPVSLGQQDAVAIRHMEMMSERSSPAERTRAKLYQYAGWAAVAGIVATGLSQAGMHSVWTWLVLVGTFAYGVQKTNRDENAHSPAGVERHKTDSYTRIRLAEIEAGDQAHARNHETFNRVVERVYGANYAQDRNPPQR